MRTIVGTMIVDSSRQKSAKLQRIDALSFVKSVQCSFLNPIMGIVSREFKKKLFVIPLKKTSLSRKKKTIMK